MALTTQVGIDFVARNRANAQISSFNRALARMGRQMLSIAGVGGGLYAIKRGFDSIIGAAMTQEKAERELIAATEGSINSLKVYAAELQKLTIYGDEQIISQMAYAANLGVTTDKLREAATAAIGLAARFRIDLSSAMMLVGRASQGQTQLLTRYGIVIDQNLSDLDKFNELLRIGADSFKLAEEQARTAEGTWIQFKNAVGDAAEELGGPFLDNITKAIRKFMEYQNMWEEAVKKQKEAGTYMNQNRGFSYGTPGWQPGIKGPIVKESLAPEMSWQERMGLDIIKRDEPFKRKLEDLLRQRQEAAKIQEKYLPVLEREIAITGRIGEAHWHAAKMVDFENAIKKAGITDQETLNKLTEQYALKLKELERAQQLARIAEDIGSAFTDAFEDAIFEAKKFDEVMRSVIRSIAKSVMHNLIFQPAGLAITGGIKGLLFPGAAPTAAAAEVSYNQAYGAAWTVPAQRGGLFKKPTLTYLAEAGPELVTPLSELQGGMLGGGVVINLNYQGLPMGIDRYSQRYEEEKRIIDVWANNVVRGGQAKQVILEVINSNVE